MELPLINILIRTSNRPELFARCLQSVKQQTYQHINIIVGYDNIVALHYLPAELQRIPMPVDYNYPYHYDLYCNHLKGYVTTGWFFFLDDDDTIASPDTLQQLSNHISSPHEAIICQMLRNSVPKPADNYIRKKVIREGKIGLPCLVLHSKHKALSGLDGYKGGDYRYIKEVTDQVPTIFITLPLVNAGSRGHGKMESNTQISNISE